MFVDSGFNYNVKELLFPKAGKHMFLYFQSGLFQLPSTSWTNAVLQIHSPSININTFTNWCIISLQCSKYPAQSPHNQIFGKKKKNLKINFPFYFPSWILEFVQKSLTFYITKITGLERQCLLHSMKYLYLLAVIWDKNYIW